MVNTMGFDSARARETGVSNTMVAFLSGSGKNFLD